MIVTLGVAGGTKGNGAHGTSAKGVCGIIIFENLHVSAKLKMHVVEHGVAGPGHNGIRTEGVGNAILVGELIQATNGIGHHVMDHEAGKALEGKSVGAGTQALLDGANGSFNFADMAVSGHNVHGDR